jgi:hypothetical protein
MILHSYNGRVLLQNPVCQISVARLKYSYAYDIFILKCNTSKVRNGFLFI